MNIEIGKPISQELAAYIRIYNDAETKSFLILENNSTLSTFRGLTSSTIRTNVSEDTYPLIMALVKSAIDGATDSINDAKKAARYLRVVYKAKAEREKAA